MKIDYQYTFGLPRKIVWKYVRDERVLKNAIPGCKSFFESEKGKYLAEVEVNVGPIKEVLTLQVQLENEKFPTSIYLFIKGKGKLGAVEGKATLLLDEHQGSTKLTISVDGEVTGAFSGASKRILNGGLNAGMENFFNSVEKEIKRSLYLLRKGRKV